ncbi:MAG: hypothetical protein IJX67_03410 [Oscillospiraceae bacterium]|nr:hypothetical protein [Oscillospiraceae bacterium]
MWKTVRKLFASVLSVCMIIAAVPVQALAYDGESNEAVAIEESTTATVSLLNYDGSETLTVLEVAVGTELTQADLTAEIDPLLAIRGGYKFVGWSLASGEVGSSYVATPSFTITDTTILYAVHRPLTANDVDANIGSELLTSIETFDDSAVAFGFSADTLSEATIRSDDFYSSINSYLNGLLADTPTTASAMTTSSSPTISAQRFAHAYADATWSTGQRSDLSFPKEVVYMFTSHYIDVAEPLSGTTIGHDQSLYQMYITDLDRRTYETYYQNSSHIEWYRSMFDFVSVLADVPETASGIADDLIDDSTDLDDIYDALSSLRDTYEGASDAINNAVNSAYLEISTMTYVNESELFEQIDALTQEVYDDLSVDYAEMTQSAAESIVAAALVLTGSAVTLSSIMGMAGFYVEFILTLMDSAYFVNMRAYIQTRVGERMMYALGMSDGRN